MGDERGALDLQGVEDPRNVPGLSFLVVAAGRLGGEAHAAEVRDDHGLVASQILCKRHPHVAGLAIAVQQQNCWSRASDAHMQLRSVCCDVMGAEGIGEGEFILSVLRVHSRHVYVKIVCSVQRLLVHLSTIIEALHRNPDCDA